MSHKQSMKTIIVADDHPIFRQGLVSIVALAEEFSILAEVADGAEALRCIQELHPDIAILDISMPVMNGIEVAREVLRLKLDVDIIILTLYNDSGYFDAAVAAGVKGYVLKENAINELVSCLRAVAGGDRYITPSMSGMLIDRRARTQSLLRTVPEMHLLTNAEREVLRLLADNKTSKEIGDTLFISARTVENHRAHIAGKLGLKGHNALLEFAIKHKLAF